MKNYAPIALNILLVITLIATTQRVSAQSDSLMQFLEPLIGEWATVPDSAMLRDFPEMTDAIGFKFAWADDHHKLLRFYEGIPQGDLNKRILETLVAANPRTGTVEFLGYQLRNDFLFKGSFEPLGKGEGFIRLYDVYYPHDTQFRHRTDEMKGMKSYRDICRLVTSDTLECTTEQFDFGQYQPWGNGAPFRMTRKSSGGAAGNASNSGGLAALNGKWLSRVDEKYKNHPMIQAFNPDLKPQLLETVWAADRSFLHLKISNVDQPAQGDTTLFVKGFIIPDPGTGAAKMLEYNVDSGITFSGSYSLDEASNIIRQFTDCATGNEGRKFKEVWQWTDATKEKFEWHMFTYQKEIDAYVKGDIVVEWKKIG